MKFLFITSGSPNGLDDSIYNGLKKIKNISVYDYPYKPLNHARYDNGKISAFDLNNKKIYEEDKDGKLKLLGNPEIYGYNASHWDFTIDSKKPVEAINDLDSFDWVILGSTASIETANKNIIKKITESKNDNLIFLDGDDNPFILLSYLKKSKLYIKREKLVKQKFSTSMRFLYWKFMKKFYFNPPKYKIPVKNILFRTYAPQFLLDELIKPINLTIPDHKFKKAEHKIFDISFIGSITNPSRKSFVEKLQLFVKKNGLKAFISTSGKIGWNEYSKIINASKISLSLPGSGYDTFRYWEIPYYESALASPQLPIQINNNFEDMHSAILFKNFKEFEEKTLTTLKTGSWDEISKNGKRHFLKYHTTKNRAETLLKYLYE